MLSCKTTLWCIVFVFFAAGVKAQSVAPPQKADFKLIFEKTYLHTDRDVYAQGDTLWFKAYLLNGQNHTLTKTSGTLYVDLIASDEQVIETKIIRLENGLGNGDFELIDTLTAGKYRLRAYTNWMRNFGDTFIFEKAITLAGIPVAAKPSAIGNDKAKKSTKTEKYVQVAVSSMQANVVSFYPEGGSMVEGITSIIAVKAENYLGKGIAVKGAVVSSSGDTITHFTCDTLGMGLFPFLPMKAQTYKASVVMGSKPYQFQLPAALAQGLTLQVKQTDSVLHAVISNNSVQQGAINKSQYTISVKHSGHAIISQTIQSAGSQTAVKIPTAQLPEGIAAITVYDEQNRPACQRLVYIHHTEAQNTALITNKKTYQPFEKTTVQINAGKAAYLSVAVVDVDVVPNQADDIRTYLMLGSELKGNIEQSRRYFDSTNVNRFKQLDLLLLTQGWRDFIWRKLADSAIRVSYAAEQGITVAGLVKDEVNRKPMPGLNVTLRANGAKDMKMFSARSDLKGRFTFPDLALYGKQTIQLAAVNDKGATKGTFNVDTFFTMPVKPVLKRYLMADTNAVSVITQAMVQKTIAANKAKGITQLKEVKISGKRKIIDLDNGQKYMTWGDPQVLNVTPQDYWTKNLSWFVQQKLNGAKSARDGRPGIGFLVDGKMTYPIMIVNGSTFHIDKELYYGMNIEKFKRIELQAVAIRAKIYYLLFLTTNGNPLIDNPGSLSVDVQGYYQARGFYKPVNDGVKSPKADIRTTIHWEPNIKTDINGQVSVSFYNTSGSSKVNVVLQGITADGVPVSKEVSYTVK